MCSKWCLWLLWLRWQRKMSNNTIFCHLGEGGALWDKLAHRDSGNSNNFGIWWKLQIPYCLFWPRYESHSPTFYKFYLKRTQRMVFKKTIWSKNKTRQNAEGLAICFKFLLLNNFLRNLVFKQCDPNMVTPVGIRVKYYVTYSLGVMTKIKRVVVDTVLLTKKSVILFFSPLYVYFLFHILKLYNWRRQVYISNTAGAIIS